MSRRARLAHPTHGGPAGRAEIMVDPGPGVTRAGIDLVRTVEPNAFARKIRGAAPWRARAALAVLAMADVDHDRLGGDDDAEAATQALCGSRHLRCLPLNDGPIIRQNMAARFINCVTANDFFWRCDFVRRNSSGADARSIANAKRDDYL